MITVNVLCLHTDCLQLLSPVYILCCLHVLSFSQCEYFSAHYCTIVHMHCYMQYCLQLLSPVNLLCCLHMLSFSQCEYFTHITIQLSIYNVYIESSLLPTVLFTITVPSILTLLFTYAFIFTMWIFYTHYYTIVDIQCLHWIFSVYMLYCLQSLSPVYCLCCLHMLIFHNVIFFHNYCPICSITMSIAYPQHILTVLFTISVPNKLTALFTHAFLFTMWIFLHSYCIIFYSTMLKWGFIEYMQCCLQLLSPVYCLCCLHMLPFHNVIFFSQLLTNWLYNIVYSISLTYTYSTVYNYSPQYTYFAVHICFPFHNVNIFHNYCTIVYSTMFTVRLHWIHTVLFTITIPS